MTLDREAARALFENADATPAAPPPLTARSVYTPQPSAADAGPLGHDAVLERLASSSAGKMPRKGVDWRLIAPLGVAAVCAGAVALFAIPRDDAIDGKTVASTEITAPPVAEPLAPPPADLATVDNTAAAAPAAVATPAPAPVVQRAASRPAPVAARRAPARQVAAAPSAEDSASNVSAREPYLPTPTLGAPAAVTLTPTTPAPAPATPPIVQPTPPVTEPEPQL